MNLSSTIEWIRRHRDFTVMINGKVGGGDVSTRRLFTPLQTPYKRRTLSLGDVCRFL